MRLTQPLKLWQLTFFATLVCTPLSASAGWLPNASIRRQPLEPEQFPRDIVLVGELPDGVGESAFARAADAAARSWSDVGCAAITLRWRGTETTVPPYDEATTITFVDPAADRCFLRSEDIAWTLQQACCSSGFSDDGCEGAIYPPQTILLNRTEFSWLEQPDPYGPSTDDEKLTVDVESVLTHELGHVLDLRHDDSDPLATMAPRYLRDGGLSTLAAADRAALCERWPNGATDCSTDDDCTTFGDCVSLSGFDVCEEERATPGQYCDLGQLTCADRCHVTSPAAFTGYCTSLCTGDGDCPSDMYCDDEISECRLTATPVEPGCSTARRARSSAVWWALAFLTMWVSRRRSRWTALLRTI